MQDLASNSVPPPFDPRAEAVFASYLEARERGEALSFEGLCAQHPELAHDLRRQQEVTELARRLIGRGVSFEARPFAERLRELYGVDVDPGVSLADERERKSDTGPSSKLFDKLRSEGPRGTRYRLLGEVARGGMGAVLRVWDDELRRTLAMKVVLGKREHAADSGDDLDVDPRTLGRFLEEAQITGQLDHPGIVPVHELGLDATGRVYFTMRLVKGEELREVFEHVRHGRHGWSQVRALNVLLRVCETMAFAHAKQVIHRDLKPANVMVGRFGEVVVMDWGLARVLGREDRHDLRLRTSTPSAPSVVRTERYDADDAAPDSPLITLDGDVVGTPSYMPPEQARGELERLGPHSDVYSIGAMLYQLVTGTMPYVPDGARVSPHTILMAVLHGPPPSVESLAPRTPPELVAICDKAMARAIGDRYPTTDALAADLRAYLEGRVVAAYETGTWAETRKWVKRNKLLAGSLAAAILAIVAGMVVVGSKTREANAQKERAEARADALWAIQELSELGREVRDRQLAHSRPRPLTERWLESARRLVDGRQADEARGVARRPGLVDHQRLLAALRRDSSPPTGSSSTTQSEQVESTIEERETRWWEEQLAKLEVDLVLLREQLAVAERCATSAVAQRLWSDARAAIQAHPQYAGLDLAPQLFLWPLGPDPDTGLWEFAHLLMGEPPDRGADGRLVLTDEMGLVLVLLPGGQVPVEEGRDTRPLNFVTLEPFFLSKYELTRAQWSRVSPGWTARFRTSVTPLLPASGVSWSDCQRFFSGLPASLGLPTEAQWEYGCRAGTESPWWTGTDPGTLNVAAVFGLSPGFTQSLGGVDPRNVTASPDVEAKGSIPQPIGTLLANAFGLHDVHGNLWEWCLDAYAEAPEPREGDGLWDEEGAPYRVIRGGSAIDKADDTRSGHRHYLHPSMGSGVCGVRPRLDIMP